MGTFLGGAGVEEAPSPCKGALGGSWLAALGREALLYGIVVSCWQVCEDKAGHILGLRHG